MLFSDSLEIAIGLTFVFLLLSLVMTAVAEVVESILKARGAKLFDGIVELLDQPGSTARGVEAATAIYRHPLVQGLFRGEVDAARLAKQLPSYVPARNFALAFIDQVLTGAISPAETVATIPAHAPLNERLALAAERIQNDHIRQMVLQAAEIGGGDLERTRRHVEAWYDSGMDRVSGWYKRRTQALLFWLGLAVAVAINANTLTIADSLSKNASIRRAVAEQAENFGPGAEASRPLAQRPQGGAATTPIPATPIRSAPSADLKLLEENGLPMGWGAAATKQLTRPVADSPRLFGLPVLGGLQIVLGYLMTALAITLGAPFWFDVLNRLMVIRATVKPTEKSPEEGSEDRRNTAGARRTELTIRTDAPPAPPPVSDVIDTDIYAVEPDADERMFEDEEPLGPAGGRP